VIDNGVTALLTAFVSIFNGKDLHGWAGATDAAHVRDGVLIWHVDKGGTLYWNEPLQDFQVRLEFKLTPGSNNGLAIRYPGTGEAAYVAMCELQILDDNAAEHEHLDPRQYHGSAYGLVAARRGFLRPTGEWNFQEVTVQGTKIEVTLNGMLILDTDLKNVDPAQSLSGDHHPGKNRNSGFFGFVGHGDPVEFRNIFIRKLTN
jgi:hypothetical protein